MIDQLATHVEYYLPIYIPTFLAIMSILAGVLTRRIKLQIDEVLKLHNDFVLALFSFVIWALITYAQTNHININRDYDISMIRVVFLLFADFGLLLIGLIVIQPSDSLMGNNHSREAGYPTSSRARRWVNGMFLAVTALMVLLPFALMKPTAKAAGGKDVTSAASRFRVLIPYSDASIVKQIGPRKWGDRLLVGVTEVTAETANQATTEAVKEFRRTDQASQLMSRDSQVEIKIDQVVAQKTSR